MNDVSMMTNMAMTKATQGNFTSHQNKALANVNEQNAVKKEKELRSAAEGFEAIFIQKMWEQMRASVPENAYLSSKEEKYWQSMYDQQLGKDMAAGGGIGLANMIVEQMSKDRVTSPSTSNISKANNSDSLSGSASLNSSSGFGREMLKVEPAPLFPEGNALAQNNVNSNAKPMQNNNDKTNLYEDFDSSAQTISIANSANNSSIRNSVNVELEPIKGENYATAMSQSSQGTIPSNQTKPTSPLVMQALADLETLVNPPQPTVVKTTYRTNLPASERKAAILDAKGNVTANHLAMVEEKQRIMQKDHKIAPPVLEESDYPMELLNVNHITPMGNGQFEKAQDNLVQNRNILDGIETRYRSQTLPNQNIQELMARNMVAQNYPTVEDIEAEINRLIGKEQYAKTSPEILQSSPQPLLAQNQNIYQNIENTHVQASQNNDMPIMNTEKAMGGPNLAQPVEMLKQDVSALSPKMNMQSPLQGSLESSFGWRLDPFTKERAWHNGIDIQAKEGSPIKAAAHGVVSFVGQDPELGNVVIIDHHNGLQSVYGHNSELLVQQGEKITTGTEIAKVGMSGRATGPHLHFEIRDNGLSINPEPYLSNEVI